MKKPLTEETSVPLHAVNRQKRYTYPQLQLSVDWGDATRVAGGTTSSIVRSGGYKEPLREKSYKRTFLSATRFNGKLAWIDYMSSATSGTVMLTEGVFSGTTGMTPGFLVHPDGPSLPSNLTSTYQKYPISVPAVNIDLLSQAEVKALNKLRSKVGTPELSFGVLWGERRETCQLIEGLLSGSYRVLRAMAFKDYAGSVRELKATFGVTTSPHAERRRLQRIERNLKRELRKVPSHAQMGVAGMENAILAYNLGISPLVKDVKAAVEALTQGDMTTGYDVTARSRYSRTINDRAEGFIDKDPKRLQCKLELLVSDTHGYTVTLHATPKWDSWTLASRLGIADFSLAWELTSLSFLVDYYLAVGPWLSALNALREFTWKDGSYTQRVSRVITWSGTSTILGPGRASGVGVVNHTQRRLYSKFPLPAPPMSRRIRDLSSSDAQDAEAKRALNQAALASRGIRDALGGILR